MAKKALYKKSSDEYDKCVTVYYIKTLFITNKKLADKILTYTLESLAKIRHTQPIEDYHTNDDINYAFSDDNNRKYLELRFLGTSVVNNKINFYAEYWSQGDLYEKFYISFPKELDLGNLSTIYKINPEKAKENICFIHE